MLFSVGVRHWFRVSTGGDYVSCGLYTIYKARVTVGDSGLHFVCVMTSKC